MEEAPQANEVYPARAIGQGRILVAEVAKPAEQMGIAAQLREVEHLREIRMEIGEEAMGADSIISVGSRESLNTVVKNLLEFLVRWSGEWGGSHRFWGKDKRTRFWTARAYSRHTSWGASST